MKYALTLSFLLLIQLVRAQSADEKAVLDAEKQRFDAQVSKNYAVLEKVLSNDLVYTHSHGGSDTKQSYIQSIRDGKSKYDAIDMEEHKVRIYGNTAVINGVCMVKAVSNGETINTHLRYTDVYVRNGKQWQMVAWQSLKLPN
ncbi:nuclear transport factor 2 family protein [Spirosoma oryzicola]|uniref:nuclear transport factor 2 family protein n=1 Tax=Spirosoma oryzicola TaxID=2898794 RepID=UPI001E56454F|nr:nuclear transport factor 2 family protein [Spirosoma oryzicola]UHG89856.1 nuclear transport factor 2 family protein [Spirosoma oryzicola]